MGKRQKDWARNWTEKLRELLGGKCVRCGSTEDLTFDVIVPLGDNHGRKKEWSARISLYRREYERGNLQLLCNICNPRKNNRLELQSEPLREPDPF